MTSRKERGVPLICLRCKGSAPKLFNRPEDPALSHQEVDREDESDPDVENRTSHIYGGRQDPVEQGGDIAHDTVQCFADRIRDFCNIDPELRRQLIQLCEQFLRGVNVRSHIGGQTGNALSQ